MDTIDAQIRLAAFERLRWLRTVHAGAIPWSAIDQGFKAGGQEIRFASAAVGIFKPVQMSALLSIKTVVPKPKGKVWYSDQMQPDDQARSRSEVMSYAFKGKDPGDARNRWLRDAMERALPIIYFYGVAPGLYEAIFPTFVVGWDPALLTCELAVGDERRESDAWATPELDERRYAMRVVKQRLHQSMFRERVIAAYGSRCALTNLPEVKLVDAAHIVSDGDRDLARPDIRNGICMSKIHHAAFDANLIGVDSKFRIHVSKRLLSQHDGPMLEQGLKALVGRQIRLPQDAALWPDRERLEFRFAQFIEAA
jgi:putative restriction endonuclease